MTKTKKSWGLLTRSGDLLEQNGYPFLLPTKKAAKNWSEGSEKPVRVTITFDMKRTAQRRGAGQ
jgi:hypothetical protein